MLFQAKQINWGFFAIWIIAIIGGLYSCDTASGKMEKTMYTQNPDSTSWQAKQKRMVETQIIDRGITDSAITTAMKSIPRHRFVPDEYAEHVYRDGPLPIGYDQTISQPYIVALMTQALELSGKEKVLEIGTGSGYQAAVLAEICDSVFTIEIVKPLAEQSEALLNELGYDNVFVRYGDGYQGWEAHAPYDCIILTAAPEKIPGVLLHQLKPGGIMILPVGKEKQVLQLIRKTSSGEIQQETITAVRFVPMVKGE
jgi:protein-L-isoaspartate(D-aspartate) O-methyltransferase